MNYDDLTLEQEQDIIIELKIKLRNIVLEDGYYSGLEKQKYLAVYALLELAYEVAFPECELFIAAANEVFDVFPKDDPSFMDYGQE